MLDDHDFGLPLEQPDTEDVIAALLAAAVLSPVADESMDAAPSRWSSVFLIRLMGR